MAELTVDAIDLQDWEVTKDYSGSMTVVAVDSGFALAIEGSPQQILNAILALLCELYEGKPHVGASLDEDARKLLEAVAS